MDKTKVLFICVHNSGRSQMAETLLRQMAGDGFAPESAGLEPADAVNPLVVESMREVGVDLSEKKPRSVFDLFKQGKLFDYVITVCDEESEKKCPVFPGVAVRWHWPFPDPAKARGTHEEQLAQVRAIREAIRERLKEPFGKDFKAEDPFARPR